MVATDADPGWGLPEGWTTGAVGGHLLVALIQMLADRL